MRAPLATPAPLFIAGAPAWDENWDPLPPFPVSLNSPDLSGDLEVSLTDVVLFTVQQDQLQVLLIRRGREPFAGRRSPGHFTDLLTPRLVVEDDSRLAEHREIMLGIPDRDAVGHGDAVIAKEGFRLVFVQIHSICSWLRCVPPVPVIPGAAAFASNDCFT